MYGMKQRRLRAALVAGMIVSLTATAGMAVAATFRVSPVTIEVTNEGAASAVTVTNDSDRPITIQSRLFRWTQTDGREALDPTDVVVASPPMMTIPVGQSHVVRLVRVAAQRAAQEEAYRILVDEVPDPRSGSAGVVTFLLRQSLPVFFGSRPLARPDVTFALQHGATGWRLFATNRGQRRERLNDVAIHDSRGSQVMGRKGLMGYVLAGGKMSWPVDLPVDRHGPLTLDATSDQGNVHTVIAEPSGG